MLVKDRCPECKAFTESGSKEVYARHPSDNRIISINLSVQRCNKCGWLKVQKYEDALKEHSLISY